MFDQPPETDIGIADICEYAVWLYRFGRILMGKTGGHTDRVGGQAFPENVL